MNSTTAVNLWRLKATLAERKALRYTPAGLPALDLTLAHEGEVVHEGVVRKVALQARALAIGSIVRGLEAWNGQQPATFEGFLSAGRNGKGLVFHITAWQTD